MKYFLITTAFLTSLLLPGCLFSHDSGSGDPSGGAIKTVGTYKVVGNTIISPMTIDTTFYCGSVELMKNVDTSFGDTLTYEIIGQQMKVKFSRLDTTRSGALVQVFSKFTRVGSGSGLEGTWNMDGYSYTVLSGTLTPEEKAEFDKEGAGFDSFAAFSTRQVIFSNGMIYTKSDIRTAERFIAEWNGFFAQVPDHADSAYYDVSLKVINKQTVELKGNILAETVTLVIDQEGNRVFTSTNPDHAVYHYESTPKTCPNEPEPEWYSEFLSGNLKGGNILRKPTAGGSKPLKTFKFYHP